MSVSEAMADILDDTIGNMESNGNKVPGWLDTGFPELNIALSGSAKRGIPMSRMIEIFGAASCGKTFLSTMVMKSAQEADGIAFFADHERSFDPELAKQLGLSVDDKNKFRWLKPETFEASVDLCIAVAKKLRRAGLPMEKPIVWVFDSVASMVPHAKIYDDKGKERDVGDYNMRDKLSLASATSQAYPMLAQVAADYNVTVLLLNQIRIDPMQMFGDPKTTPGGKAAEFYCSIRLSLGKRDVSSGTGKDKQVVGALVTAKAIKNKVTRPFLTASWAVRFTADSAEVDYIGTNLDFLIRAGIVKKEGTRVEWEGKKMYQSQVEQLLREDPNGHKKLMGLLDDAGELKVEEESSLEGLLSAAE